MRLLVFLLMFGQWHVGDIVIFSTSRAEYFETWLRSHPSTNSECEDKWQYYDENDHPMFHPMPACDWRIQEKI